MAAARKFEDLIAWQLASQLCDVIFDITVSGPAARDFEFRNQIRNAAKKAPPLISEGFLRWTPGEFVRYLRMARGELGEVQNHLSFARRRRYCSEEDLARAEILARRAMAATTRLLQSKLPPDE
jgi:four helix bundle protein